MGPWEIPRSKGKNVLFDAKAEGIGQCKDEIR